MNLGHAIETFRGHTVPRFDFVGRRNRWFAFSGALVVLSIVGLLFVRIELSIDFEGGTRIAYPLRADVTAQDVSSLLDELGHPDAEVQIVNGNQIAIRTAALTEGDRDEVISALARQAGVERDEVSDEVIGPSWGGEISRKALIGLVVVLAMITLYITVRFELKMAIGAMVALVHDVVITAGVYALVGREVTPETVIAILTILGFSLYDTVVIYDKIKENTESTAMVQRLGYGGVVNHSLNQVLMRSVNTSLVVLFPILSLLLYGGDTLKDFAFAMFVGVAIGAYSSIFVAAPVLVVLKEREPRYQQLEAKRQAREEAEGRAGALATSGAAARAATARTGAARPGSRPRSRSKRPQPKRKRR
jgi:preprotein translocase subunit SecF